MARVMRDGKKMELVTIVVVDEAGGLLERFGLIVEPRLGAEGKHVLPPCDERLFIPAPDRLAAEQPQEARTFAEREQALPVGRAQPLEFERQLSVVEIVLLDGRRVGALDISRRWDV